MSGFRKMAALQMSAPLKAVTDKPFPASYSDRVRKIGVVNAKNKVLTAIAAALMDGPAALRHYMIDTFVVEGFTFDEVMSDDEALEAFVRKAAIGVWHASCSCRMGRPDDPMAVVDTQGRVKGVQGLRVVDASIFPVVPCANTNFPDPDGGGKDRRNHAVNCQATVAAAEQASTRKDPADLHVNEVERILPAHHASGRRRRKVRRAHQRRGIAEAAEQFPPRACRLCGVVIRTSCPVRDIGLAAASGSCRR